MHQAFILLTMAMQLLTAASHPNIPIAIREKAISIANLAINVSLKEINKSQLSVLPTIQSTPSPTPIQVSTPIPTPIFTPIPTPSPNPIQTPIATPSPSPILSSIIPLKPVLITEPIVGLSRASNNDPYVINSISYKADRLAACKKDIQGHILSFEKECSVTGSTLIRTQYISDCDVVKDSSFPYQYFFNSNEEHTCKLLLTDENGNDDRISFTFTTP